MDEQNSKICYQTIIYESQITTVKVDKLRNFFAVENSRLSSTPLFLNSRDRVCSTLMKHYVHSLKFSINKSVSRVFTMYFSSCNLAHHL